MKSGSPGKSLRMNQQHPKQRPPDGLEPPLSGLELLWKHLSKGRKGGKKIKFLQAVKIKQNTKGKEGKRKMATLYIFFFNFYFVNVYIGERSVRRRSGACGAQKYQSPCSRRERRLRVSRRGCWDQTWFFWRSSACYFI